MKRIQQHGIGELIQPRQTMYLADDVELTYTYAQLTLTPVKWPEWTAPIRVSSPSPYRQLTVGGGIYARNDLR